MEDEIFDFQLACSEALALVLGCESRRVSLVVDVEGSAEQEVVSVRIRDYGLSYPRRDLGDGLGVWLLRGMMDRVEVDVHDDGYAIELTRALADHSSRPLEVDEPPPLEPIDLPAVRRERAARAS